MSGITNPAEKYFKDGLWTFDGSVWRPQNQIFGFRSGYRETLYNGDAGAGTITLQGTVVPSGEVWFVTNTAQCDANSAITQFYTDVLSAASPYMVNVVISPAAGRLYSWTGNVAVFAGERVEAVFNGVVLHDALYCYILGVKMKVAE